MQAGWLRARLQGPGEGNAFLRPLLCRAAGVDMSLVLTAQVPEAPVASGLEEPVVDPECVSGLGGRWGWVSRWEADLGSPAWSMPHAGRSVACAARGAVSSCSSPGPVCSVALLPWCSPQRPRRCLGPTAAGAALAALTGLFLGGPLSQAASLGARGPLCQCPRAGHVMGARVGQRPAELGPGISWVSTKGRSVRHWSPGER